MYYDLGYLLVVLASLVLGLGTQAYINAQYKKFEKVPAASGMTGAQMARRMLDANGLAHVMVQPIGGTLTDHYDPRSNVISLSQAVYNGSTVSAAAIACHECAHAIQHASSYAPARLRQAVFPVVNLASNLWYFALMAGFFLGLLELIWLAIIMYGAVLAFQLVTLPVEFNASNRAMAFINSGYLPSDQGSGARKVLNAAALTYLAGALISILNFVRLLGRARR